MSGPFKLKNKKDFDFGTKGGDQPVTINPSTGEWKGIHVREGQGHERQGKYKSKQKKPVKPFNIGTDKFGERDFSEHNLHARKTEGTIAQQDALRKANKKNK